MRAKQNLFLKYAESNHWKIKYFNNLPLVHTLRDFTIAEQEEEAYFINNLSLKGVRTYFYNAHHLRGLPEFNFDFEGCQHDDFAWVPKRLLNEYFTREYYEIFIDAMLTR